jgi:membrane protein YqaA with SNARE-associated domain
MFLARFHIPVLVVVVATVGSVLGWLALGAPLRRWMQSKPHLQNYVPAAYQRVFLRRTGLWLFLFNALPFPFDPIRFLALLNDYSRVRSTVVLAFARLARNIMLVTIGALLAQYKLLFALALVVFMVLPILLDKIMRRVVSRMAVDEPVLTPPAP